jgi:hypothetical protein
MSAPSCLGWQHSVAGCALLVIVDPSSTSPVLLCFRVCLVQPTKWHPLDDRRIVADAERTQEVAGLLKAWGVDIVNIGCIIVDGKWRAHQHWALFVVVPRSCRKLVCVCVGRVCVCLRRQR